MLDAETGAGILDIVAAALLIVAALLTLAAAIGLVRFPDPLSRLHAATKPQILGLILVVIAIALSARSGTVLLLLVPVVVFQLLTAPISAHMVGRAGYRNGDFDPDSLLVDELAPDVDAARGTELPGGSWTEERAAVDERRAVDERAASDEPPSKAPSAGS
ncbi:monovalent cation/H(+) antiporter subunit G [Microcella sp.]|uniref:monovalent cation/H(+) antiporter subunit G n=1 Tax=Microcella sp. TaxID=1913979 RepID=UPI00391C0075